VKKLLIIIFSLISVNCFCQSLDSIKHIEIISEIRDSMALINKEDVDKINNTFYELEVADSLNHVNDSIINLLVVQNNKLDSIMRHQKIVIENNDIIKTQIIADHTSEIDMYKKELKRSNNKKILWQSTTGASILAIILLILL